MSELPKCLLCGEETEEILVSGFKPRHKVNYICPLSKVVFTREQWTQLMGAGEVVAWMYKSEPNFDGQKWYDTYETTSSY